MMITVMATILEKVDNPANAIPPCKVCLEELHVLPAVKKNFSIALAKGRKYWFGKGDLEEIVAAVRDINHAIFHVTLMVGSDSLIWPTMLEQRMCTLCGTQELLNFINGTRNTLVFTLCNGGLEWVS